MVKADHQGQLIIVPFVLGSSLAIVDLLLGSCLFFGWFGSMGCAILLIFPNLHAIYLLKVFQRFSPEFASFMNSNPNADYLVLFLGMALNFAIGFLLGCLVIKKPK